MTMPRRLLAGLAGLALWAGTADARPGLRHVLRTAPSQVGLNGVGNDPRYQNAADALLESGIRQLPIHPAMGGAYQYAYDPSCGCYQRATEDMGPWFVTERANTVGDGLLNVGVTVGQYNLKEAFGCRYGEERNPLKVSAAGLNYRAGTELIYQVATLNVTYGLTDDIDLNFALPVAAIDLGVNASHRGSASGPVFGSQHFHVGPNIMDMMVRAKVGLFNSDGWVGASGMRARLPTGDASDGLGTGYGEVGPWMTISKPFFDGWLDSHWDFGFDANVSNALRSSGHYSWALDVQKPGTEGWSRVALATQLLGRSEINGVRAESSVCGPHVTRDGVVKRPYQCLDPTRHDYFDVVLGLRVRLLRSLIFSFGVFKPINDEEGVRPSDWSPVASLEATF